MKKNIFKLLIISVIPLFVACNNSPTSSFNSTNDTSYSSSSEKNTTNDTSSQNEVSTSENTSQSVEISTSENSTFSSESSTSEDTSINENLYLVKGVVIDSEKKYVQGVDINLKNESSSLSTTTNELGQFEFNNVAEGSYTLSISFETDIYYNFTPITITVSGEEKEIIISDITLVNCYWIGGLQ